MDENISRAAGAAHGQLLDEEALERAVSSAGRRLRRRTTLYDLVPARGAEMSQPAPPQRSTARVVWRVLVLVFAAIALFLFGQFVLEDGGSVLFILLMSWFASIAMEPAVSRLSQHMKRGLATGLVMVAFALATVVFFLLFGSLLADQLIQLVRGLPNAIEELIAWINQRFDTNLDPGELLKQAGLGPGDVAGITADLASGVLAVLFGVVSAFFSLFTFALFTFYFSADAPRLTHWIAGLLPPKRQSRSTPP